MPSRLVTAETGLSTDLLVQTFLLESGHLHSQVFVVVALVGGEDALWNRVHIMKNETVQIGLQF